MNGHRTWTDSLLKKKGKQPLNLWKDAHSLIRETSSYTEIPSVIYRIGKNPKVGQ